MAQIKEFKKRQLRPSLLSDADDVDNPQSRILWNLEERDAGKFRRKEKARVKKQSNLRDLWPLGLLIIGIVLLSISIGRNFYLQHQVAEIKMNKQITLNQELPANKQATASANQSTHAIKLESPTLVEPDISPEKGLGALIVDDPMLKAPENAAVPTKEIAAIEVDQNRLIAKKRKEM